MVHSIHEGHREPASMKGTNLMFRKLTTIIDSALMKAEPAVFASEGFKQCLLLPSELVRISLIDDEKELRRQKKNIAKKKIARGGRKDELTWFVDHNCQLGRKFREEIAKASRIESIIELQRDGRFMLTISVYRVGQRDCSLDAHIAINNKPEFRVCGYGY